MRILTAPELDRALAHAAALSPPADGGRAAARLERLGGFVDARMTLAAQRTAPRPETVDYLRRCEVTAGKRWTPAAELAGVIFEAERAADAALAERRASLGASSPSSSPSSSSSFSSSTASLPSERA